MNRGICWLIIAVLVVGCGGGAATTTTIPNGTRPPPDPEPVRLDCGDAVPSGGERTVLAMVHPANLCPVFAAVGVGDEADIAEARALLQRLDAGEATTVQCPGAEDLDDSIGRTLSCYIDVTAATVPACRGFAAAVLVRYAEDHHRVNLSIQCHPGEVSARVSRGDYEVDVGDDYWMFRAAAP